MAKFQKGVSGNPSGRPKENPRFAALCQSVTEEAFEGLCEFMRDKSAENRRLRLKAIEMLMANAWGHPPAAVALKAEVEEDSAFARFLKSIDGQSRQLPPGNLERFGGVQTGDGDK